MNHITGLWRGMRHVLTFCIHFAHGGLLMTGVLVLALLGYQWSAHGSEGLNPRHFLSLSAPLADEEPLAVDVLYHEQDLVKVPDAYSKVASAVGRRFRISPIVVNSLITAAKREGSMQNIDPLLILAVITVESSFNPYAESVVGAQGLMQIVPRYHPDKIASDLGAAALFDPAENIRVGALILREYLRTEGNLEAALQRYGGASGDPAMFYSGKVLQEFERLRRIAGLPLERTAARTDDGSDRAS
ncbi:MAG: hypothetical protein BSR46_14105 [Candidatus Dactylopiibacterium carminicum]|nr:MAG: hypothetical protein BSR46_14105 [Candidatus Dactylopiibacterium carminicum]